MHARPLAAGLVAVLTLLTPAIAAGPRSAPPATTAPARVAPFRVAVIGDSFAVALAAGLRGDLGLDPGVAIEDGTRLRAGLMPGAEDALAVAEAVLGTTPPDAALVMLGSVDAVPPPDDAGGGEVASPAWSRAYRARVGALAGVFAKAGVPLVWVGLPIVADEAVAASFAALNEAVREDAKAGGFRFVDSWDAFSDDAGRYAASGPDRNGRPARLRAPDGRGFTRDGALKLASFVEGDLRRLREAFVARQAATDALATVAGREPAFENDVGAQIRRELGLPAVDPGRPEAAGPVVVVTAPPRAPGGQLATAELAPAPLANAGGSLAERILVEGRPLPPRTGRVDDFSWPKR